MKGTLDDGSWLFKGAFDQKRLSLSGELTVNRCRWDSIRKRLPLVCPDCFHKGRVTTRQRFDWDTVQGGRLSGDLMIRGGEFRVSDHLGLRWEPAGSD